MVRGFLINKFRGDVSLFDDGLGQITEFTGWESFGVVPWLPEAPQLPGSGNTVWMACADFVPNLAIADPTLERGVFLDVLDNMIKVTRLQVATLRRSQLDRAAKHAPCFVAVLKRGGVDRCLQIAIRAVDVEIVESQI